MSSRPIEICKLCLEVKQLSRSHIIPEFMHLEMYDEKHRALMVESDPKTKERHLQKGEREFLFCDECEGRISKFEAYAAPIVKSMLNLEAEEVPDAYRVAGVMYPEFKLFQVSLLWRASVASIEMFGNVSLGDHEERLREMIFSEDPGMPDEYGCLMMAMEETKYLNRIIWSPETDEIDGFPVYRFQTGRLFWYFFLPNHVPADGTSYFLTESGVLLVPKAPWSEELVIQRLASRIAEAQRRRSGDNA